MSAKCLAKVVLAGCCALPLIAAAEQGDWLFRAGAHLIDPKSDNLENVLGDPDLTLEVDDAVGFTFNVTYMFADHWGVELLAAWPFNHDISLTGFGNIAETDHLPPTLSLQYHFLPDGRFRPYIGAGINYTTFMDEEFRGSFLDALDLPSGTKLKLDDSFGPSVQIGADIAINYNWFVNIDIRWFDIDTDAEIRLPITNSDPLKLGTVEIDPIAYGIMIGYRFGSPKPAAVPVAATRAAPPPPPPPAAPRDSDGDGVPDDKDACPNTPRGDRVDAFGCSCDVTVNLEFEFDSDRLTAGDQRRVDEVIANLKRLPFVYGTVEGHTDDVGDAAYNMGLSERRAQAVIDYMAANGINTSRLAAKGLGESQPVASNATEEGRAQNRRVVLRRTDCGM
jgi:outer membrane protein